MGVCVCVCVSVCVCVCACVPSSTNIWEVAVTDTEKHGAQVHFRVGNICNAWRLLGQELARRKSFFKP